MSFVSVEFGLFFALFALVYFAARGRPPVILAGSLIFALWGGGLLATGLLVAAALVTYGMGLRLGAATDERGRRGWLIAGVTFNLGLLAAFKLAEAAGAWSGVPLGISFYTFTAAAYIVDLYRRVIPVETHLGRFGAHLAFFPKLTAGPIERAGHLLPQLHEVARDGARFDEGRVVEGLRLILWGLFKKIVVADRLAIYVNSVYDDPSRYTGLPLLTATVFFAFQIYCDFSSYSDIALGLARILGFRLTDNFRQPYLSRSVLEFWRRWHITLTSWIRDYVFLPLSRALLKRTGRRRPRLVEMTAYLVVMTLVGLWHGLSATFLVWGALHGLYMSIETLWNAVRRRRPENAIGAAARTLLTFALVGFAWIFFRAESLPDAQYIILNLFNLAQGSERVMEPFREALFPRETEFALALVVIGVVIAADWLTARGGDRLWLASAHRAVRWAAYYLLALAIGISLWSTVGATPEFIYAGF